MIYTYYSNDNEDWLCLGVMGFGDDRIGPVHNSVSAKYFHETYFLLVPRSCTRTTSGLRMTVEYVLFTIFVLTLIVTCTRPDQSAGVLCWRNASS